VEPYPVTLVARGLTLLPDTWDEQGEPWAAAFTPWGAVPVVADPDPLTLPSAAAGLTRDAAVTPVVEW